VTATAPPGFARALLRWFDAHRRDLPWRREPSPYRTLVSEFMLQQTVVATVEPYFERFVARFPDFGALAATREDEVTALWSGLGYYARARNLRRAAIAVVSEHDGALPDDEETLRTLPGIGPYTAAAVAAIAFDRRTFALDGNGIRVLARLFAVREPVNLPATREQLRALGQSLVPAARAGDFNQAMMELGALLCAPRSPDCTACPVRAHCQAVRLGLAPEELPVKQPRAARRAVAIACALVERGGRVLLVRRQPGELLAGTWALPSADIAEGAAAEDAARAAATAEGVVATAPPVFRGRVRHVFTHRDLTADVFAVAAGRASSAGPERRWVARDELAELGISSCTRTTLSIGSERQPSRARRTPRSEPKNPIPSPRLRGEG
jgi:A/G-specific adenine glycosylase